MEYLCDVHHSISPRQLPVPNYKEAGSENKMSAWGDLKSSCHVYLPWGGGRGQGRGQGRGGAYYVSCQKKILKIRYGLEGSISNVDLSLF